MSQIAEICRAAKEASYVLAVFSREQKDKALLACAAALCEEKAKILKANQQDVTAAEQAGMSAGLVDRLRLDAGRIEDMAAGMRAVAGLPDPVGRVLDERVLENGLKLTKRAVPIGVCGIIYEARPNVTSDAFALCLKSGNACVLKGGSAALLSNEAIVHALWQGLAAAGVPREALGFIDEAGHEGTAELVRMHDTVDVLIPRGGSALIRYCVEHASIPVLETGTGNCHIFVDESADLEQAVKIILNAKTQRVGVCNACESLLIHKNCLAKAVPMIAKALTEKGVTIYGDADCRALFQPMEVATEADWGTEYLDYKISMKAVGSVEEAIRHINHYGTKHSESILTENQENAARFLREVDAACVYVNASTRFTDGGQFGFGCEIGISTGRLHARGPMGLAELTTYKYEIVGNGQVRA